VVLVRLFNAWIPWLSGLTNNVTLDILALFTLQCHIRLGRISLTIRILCQRGVRFAVWYILLVIMSPRPHCSRRAHVKYDLNTFWSHEKSRTANQPKPALSGSAIRSILKPQRSDAANNKTIANAHVRRLQTPHALLSRIAKVMPVACVWNIDGPYSQNAAQQNSAIRATSNEGGMLVAALTRDVLR